MASHCVIEVSIKQITTPSVTKGTFSAGGRASVEPTPARDIEDLTKIITRARNVNAAIEKIKRLLDAELDSMDDITEKEEI